MIAQAEGQGLDRLDRARLALQWKLAPREARRLLQLGGQGSLDAALAMHAASFRPGLAERLRDLPSREDAASVLEGLEARGVSFLEVGDAAFPEILKTIPDPPLHLFVRGPYWASLQRQSEAAAGTAMPATARKVHVAVIGARAASGSGKEIARQLSRDLALAGAVVVSGLARGVDGAAHRGALEAGGETIAVLGASIETPYPPEHRDLYAAIQSSGGLASEFPPGAPPLPLHFPRRNRILSGLCDVIVVVEGNDRSGARSTVDHALDQGREVMAVPRDILLPGSALPNRLLSEGAAVAHSARAILEQARGGLLSAGLPVSAPARTQGSASGGLPGDIQRILRNGAMRFEEILAALSAAPQELQSALAELEVMGWIRRSHEGRYAAQG